MMSIGNRKGENMMSMDKRYRGWRYIVPLLVVTAAAAACSGGSPSQSTTSAAGGGLIVALDSDVNLVEPNTFRTQAAFAATGAMYAPLLRQKFQLQANGVLQGTQDVEGGIAKSFEISKDGKEVTLNLREGAKFSDGSPVTTEDIAYTLRRAFLGPGYTKSLAPFIGISKADQIEVVDSHIVKLHPSVGSPLMKTFLTFQVFGVIEQKVTDAHKTTKDPWAFDWLNDHATPSGPYQLKQYERGQQVVLAPNPNYYDAKNLPNTGVIMRYVPDGDQRGLLLKSGAIDVATGISPKLLSQLKTDPNVKVYDEPSSRLNYLGMNTTTKPFDNVKVRQAISYAIPYKTLIDQVMYGYARPAGNVITSPMATYAGDQVGTYTTNLSKARQLLQEAGVGAVTVDLAVSQSHLANQQAAVFIQNNLREIGVTVNIRKLPDAQFSTELNNKQLPMFISDWFSWGEDPFYQMSFLVKSGAFTNFEQYSNPKLDALIAKGTFELDPAKRAEISKECQAILFHDAPMAYLYAPDWTIATRSNVKGVVKDVTEVVRFDQMSKN